MSQSLSIVAFSLLLILVSNRQEANLFFSVGPPRLRLAHWAHFLSLSESEHSTRFSHYYSLAPLLGNSKVEKIVRYPDPHGCKISDWRVVGDRHVSWAEQDSLGLR